VKSLSKVREPQAAIWGFYPLNRSALINEIKKCFMNSKLGPGSLPREEHRVKFKEVLGGIAPHAGYMYSGSCAAWLYRELRENIDRIDSVIVIGTNHTGFGSNITTCSYYKKWATPLGEIEIDIQLISKLKELYPALGDEVLAHAREHSVEVQLPFLQFLYGNEFKLVPIVVKDIGYTEARDFAVALRKAIDYLKLKTVLIASSDFTHHGEFYGYVLFKENIVSKVRELDMKFINAIVELNTQEFLKLIKKYNATVCGYGAIAIAMEYTKLLNAKARLLKYYNSADVTGDEDMVVGYAAVEFYRELA